MNQGTAEILSQMASTLGTTTKYIWSVEVKEAYVMGLIHLAWIFLLGITIAISVYLGQKSLRKARHEKEEPYGDDFEWNAGAFLCGLLIVAMLVFIGLNFTSAISCFINPQDYAFTVIASAL